MDGLGFLSRVVRLGVLGGTLATVVLLSGCGSGKTKAPAGSAVSPAAVQATAASASTATASPPPTPAAQTPVASPTEKPDDSPLARLIVPKISVNAKFVTMGLIAGTNTMDSPRNKDDIAYYDFSPLPTHGGNTLLSGHVDWYTGQTGVFWDLKKLENGDDIQVLLQDGKTLHYRVTDTHLYDADNAPTEEIVGQTPVESVTLITCEGTFNQTAAEYNKRRVVRAERVY